MVAVDEDARWSDAELARLGPEGRAGLIRRLIAMDGGPPRVLTVRVRHWLLLVAAGGSLVLVPWIAYLAVSLPHRYEASHWTQAWVGFDVALLLGLATTTWMIWRGRPALIIPALITATLLVCDAWFDTTTAHRSDVVVSGLSAAFAELPMAAVLLAAVVVVLRSVSVSSRGGDVTSVPAPPTPARRRTPAPRAPGPSR